MTTKFQKLVHFHIVAARRKFLDIFLTLASTWKIDPRGIYSRASSCDRPKKLQFLFKLCGFHSKIANQTQSLRSSGLCENHCFRDLAGIDSSLLSVTGTTKSLSKPIEVQRGRQRQALQACLSLHPEFWDQAILSLPSSFSINGIAGQVEF
jgi:hypothetical protein